MQQVQQQQQLYKSNINVNNIYINRFIVVNIRNLVMSAMPANRCQRQRQRYRNRHRNCLCLIVLAIFCCWLDAADAVAPDSAIHIQLRRRDSVSWNGIEVSLD